VFFKFNELNYFVMKRSFARKEENRNFNYFETLSVNEMLKVRGGGDLKPASRDKDILEFDEN
jgi:hypothetical protein